MKLLYKTKNALAAALPDWVEAHTVIPPWPHERAGEWRVYIIMPIWSYLFLGLLHVHTRAVAEDVIETILAGHADKTFKIFFA